MLIRSRVATARQAGMAKIATNVLHNGEGEGAIFILEIPPLAAVSSMQLRKPSVKQPEPYGGGEVLDYC